MQPSISAGLQRHPTPQNSWPLKVQKPIYHRNIIPYLCIISDLQSVAKSIKTAHPSIRRQHQKQNSGKMAAADHKTTSALQAYL